MRATMMAAAMIAAGWAALAAAGPATATEANFLLQSVSPDGTQAYYYGGPTSLSQAVSNPKYLNHPAGSAKARIWATPSPGISASATTPAFPDFYSLASSSAGGQIEYYLTIDAPGAPIGTPVPISVAVSAATGGSGVAQAEAEFYFVGAALPILACYACAPYPPSFSVGAPETMTVGSESEIYLAVSVAAYASQYGASHAFARIDPVVTIDPAFLAEYPGSTLSFSDGIGNGPNLGGVPEPAEWALMAAGVALGGGLIRQRRGLAPQA